MSDYSLIPSGRISVSSKRRKSLTPKQKNHLGMRSDASKTKNSSHLSHRTSRSKSSYRNRSKSRKESRQNARTQMNFLDYI